MTITTPNTLLGDKQTSLNAALASDNRNDTAEPNPVQASPVQPDPVQPDPDASDQQRLDQCWYLSGATAIGKTAVALPLAERLGAEVLSVDSMAVYRGMDIGTAKPTTDQRARVPHHLIDLVDPSEEFSVAQYRQLAIDRVRDVQSRGKTPLFVGGTPLYLKCLLRGLFDGPPADWDLRVEIEAELERVGADALHDRLTQVDPVAASQIHANDTRRIVRALEVYRATGQPISHQQMEFEDGRPAEECRVFVLTRPRDERAQRIEQRVDAMMDAGLVDEVRALTSGGRRLGRTASQAVGYR
ncbi:MAG: tRNA (adenosine(37)-N6)-dimethylallyltransferase MiaA, partial [Planctomycetota bacterium]